MKYRYSEGDFEKDLDAQTLEDARIEAAALLHEGDWEPGLVEADLLTLDQDEAGEEMVVSSETMTLSIPEPEPECPEGDHDWQSPHALVGGIQENPGVWGSGAGVTMLEVCASCGTYRETDTAAQCPATGRTYRKVSYREPDARSRAWVERES
jgi:hypothetical protein